DCTAARPWCGGGRRNGAPVRAPRHHRGNQCAPADRGRDPRAGALPDRERDRLRAPPETQGCGSRLAALEATGDDVLNALERDELSLNRLLIPFVPAEAGTQFFGRVLDP